MLQWGFLPRYPCTLSLQVRFLIQMIFFLIGTAKLCSISFKFELKPAQAIWCQVNKKSIIFSSVAPSLPRNCLRSYEFYKHSENSYASREKTGRSGLTGTYFGCPFISTIHCQCLKQVLCNVTCPCPLLYRSAYWGDDWHMWESDSSTSSVCIAKVH